MSEWRDLPTIEDVADAKRAGDEIEMRARCGWIKWPGDRWAEHYEFRARAVQPKMKKVKLLGWWHIDDGETTTRVEFMSEEMTDAGWLRYPKLDDEIDVPE